MTENHQYWYTAECLTCGEMLKFETTEERGNYAAKHMHFDGIMLGQLFK